MLTRLLKYVKYNRFVDRGSQPSAVSKITIGFPLAVSECRYEESRSYSEEFCAKNWNYGKTVFDY